MKTLRTRRRHIRNGAYPPLPAPQEVRQIRRSLEACHTFFERRSAKKIAGRLEK